MTNFPLICVSWGKTLFSKKLLQGVFLSTPKTYFLEKCSCVGISYYQFLIVATKTETSPIPCRMEVWNFHTYLYLGDRCPG